MGSKDSSSRSQKQVVQAFYDTYGWTQDVAGHYKDESEFEDRRPVSYPYRRACHLRVKRFLAPYGELLLDAASGPVQYPEYQEYSTGYRRHVCVDFSITALHEASQRLGAHGLYVLADVTHLPFATETFDAFVSLHTIYHVPASEQPAAFGDLYRTLKRGRSGVIVYAWKKRRVGLLRMVLPALRRIKRIVRCSHRAPGTESSMPPLYYQPHDYKWGVSVLQNLQATYSIRSWRSVDVPWMRRWVPANGLGEVILHVLYWLEDRFPHLLGRLGVYPLIVLQKRP